MVHVPYRGAPPALIDLLGGRVQVYFATTTVSIEHVRTGKLRVLAVTTAKRSEALPDIPTVGDFLPGFEAACGLAWAPKSTPVEIIDKLNKEINAGLADPKLNACLADLGGKPGGGDPSRVSCVIRIYSSGEDLAAPRITVIIHRIERTRPRTQTLWRHRHMGGHQTESIRQQPQITVTARRQWNDYRLATFASMTLMAGTGTQLAAASMRLRRNLLCMLMVGVMA